MHILYSYLFCIYPQASEFLSTLNFLKEMYIVYHYKNPLWIEIKVTDISDLKSKLGQRVCILIGLEKKVV